MHPAGQGAPEEIRPPFQRAAGVVTILLLCATCLALAFRHGAYSPSDWLPLLLALAGLALVISLTGPGVLAGRMQNVLLGLFAAQTVWTAASMLWASSEYNAWQEVDRTLLYAVGLLLAFAAVRWIGRGGLGILVTFVTAVVAVVALAIIIRLAVSPDPLAIFAAGGRLNYPVTYWNALASLLMVGFWLALGLSNRADRGEGGRVWPGGGRTWWASPLFLAVGVVLVELALLPQSRGALWAFFLVVPFYVILIPHRFRALVNLGIVVLPVVLFWSRINGVYAAINAGRPVDGPLGQALRGVAFSVAIVVGLWFVSWMAEHWLGPLSRRTTLIVAACLVVLVLAGVAGGIIYADRHTGGLSGYVQDRWTEFTSDKATGGDAGSRFSEMSLDGRLTQWKVAGHAFADNPVLGLGSQNFEHYFYQHRTTLLEVRQPHSQPMQLLAELGFPGLMLWVVFIALTLVRAGFMRFRAPDRATRVAIAAGMTAVLAWFIHSSADWLWQLAAVSLPPMMLVGGLIGGRAATAGVAWEDAGWRTAAVRGAAAVLSLAVLASAAMPYLSQRYIDMATRAGTSHLAIAAARARTAEIFNPTSPVPFSTRALLYEAAAGSALAGSQAQTEDYALAAAEWDAAADREPSNWLFFYRAAKVRLDWSEAIRGKDAAFTEDLNRSARSILSEAERLNPLSSEVMAARESLLNLGESSTSP